MNLHVKILVITGVLFLENLVLAVAGFQDLGSTTGKFAVGGGLFLVAVGAFAFFQVFGDRQRLGGALAQLGREAQELKGWINRISSGASDLSQGTVQQASSLERTASSIEEMTAMVSKSAENAKRSREVATTSLQTANHGKISVEKMIQAIEEINLSNTHIVEQINESNEKITEIVKVISEIGSKTKVINDIVFQTKLLSFNASVEAARAGEHGKGFAVVAEEVGNLAQMSGNAAREISELLSGSIQKVENIVTETKSMVERLVETGKSKVDAGTVIARQCGQVLEEVVKNVTEANHMIGEISNATEEQSQGIKEITRAVSQLDGVTRKNKDTSQEAADLCGQLMERADTLNHYLAKLRTEVNGEESAGDFAAPDSGATNWSARSRSPESQPDPAPEDSDLSEKVISLKSAAQNRKRRAGTKETAEGAARTTAGSEEVPSENDPRFKEV